MINDPVPVDRHVRRTGDLYAQQFLALLPKGQAWPKWRDSTLVLTSNGLNDYWGHVDSRAGDLLETESDPRITVELLPDWERAFGLPDPCYPLATNIDARQRMLVLVMTMVGGQSREWFTWVSNWLGFNVQVREWAPFMAGVSQVGDTREYVNSSYIIQTPQRPDMDTVCDLSDMVGPTNYRSDGIYRWEIGPPEMRFYWQVHVSTASLIWFRASAGQAGIDPHLRIITPPDLQCLLDRWKPAQTELVFSYSNLNTDDPLAGTP